MLASASKRAAWISSGGIVYAPGEVSFIVELFERFCRLLLTFVLFNITLPYSRKGAEWPLDVASEAF